MMKYLVFAVFVCSLILPKWTYAGEEIFSERVEGTDITGAVFHVYDGKYLEMHNNSNWFNDFTNYRVNNTVQLGINPDVLQTSTYTGGSITVKIEHEYWDDNTNTFVWGTAETKTLEVSYNIGGTNLIDDLSTFTFSGGHHVKVTVQSITILDVNDLFLESQVKVERYYTFDGTAVANAQWDTIQNAEFIQFFWDTKVGAESYELEFVHINDYKVDGTYFLTSELDFNFYLNSTRVETKESNYTIPNIFDHGYVIFRVRAIGRKGADFSHRYEGAWTVAESGVLSSLTGNQRYFKDSEYDPNMNWSHQVGYTEDGKRFEGLSFADGLGRGRQSISHNTETEQTIVSNVYYDELGRPVISDLPTPVDSVRLKHFPDFNRADTAGFPSYSAEYFNQITLDSCDLEKGTGFSTSYGAGKYYSSNNPDKEGENAYIPDAEKYPYSRVDYINDFSGRVKYTSAAGEELSQGYGHETQFVYPSPVQSDLNRLFGSEVGEASHYTKMITIDPNGQVYVQYTDMAGRVVASYLEGPPPTNTIALDSANLDTTVNVLIDGQLPDLGTSYPSTTFLHTDYYSEDGESHTYQYQFSPEQYENACLGTICFDCMYDLSLTIMDDCGVIYWDSTVVVNGSTFDTICNTNDTLSYVKTVSLPRGTYTISKSLSVNQSAIDQYWCFYVENDTCSASLPDIFNEYYALESFIECDDDTTFIPSDTLSECDQYREIMLHDMSPGGQYALYADSSGFMTSNDPTSIFFTDIWENTDFFDANGDTIFVTNTAGDTVTPNQLTENEFIGFFQDEWALSLLQHHPEYCYLEFCDSNLVGLSFTDSMFAVYSYQDACDSGYLLPLGQSSNLMFVDNCDSSFVDPFFDTGGGGSTFLDSIAAEMDSFITIGSKHYSIWEAAMFETMCPEVVTSAQADSCYNYHFNRPDSCQLDLFWVTFRDYYADLKASYYYEAMHAYAVANGCENDCIGSDSSGCANYADKIPRFANFTTYFGYDPSANLDSLNTVYSQTIANSCQSSCEQYATDWLTALDSCDFSSLTTAQMDSLYEDLVDLCMAGCDSLHPVGATTAPPGDTTAGGHTTIDEVLVSYLGSNYENEWCTELLVDAPGPYQSTEEMQGIVTVPLDTCACDAVLQAQYDLANNNPYGFTYVEEMLAYNTGISMADVDYLICACEEAICTGSTWSSTYAWNSWNGCEPAVPFPLPNEEFLIPATLSCNDCDINCDSISIRMDTLDARFNHVTSFDSAQNYETIVRNYLNAEFNYHLTYADYAEFIGMCGADSLNPYCTVSEAAMELPEVLTLLAYRGQLTNPSSNEVELADANIVYDNTDVLQYLFTDDDYWSSQADSTLTMYLDSGGCSITLTAYDGFDFSSIVDFGTIAPSTENCSGNNGFEVLATYLDCGQLQTTILTGNSGCFEINECVCDTTNLMLCDDWFEDDEGPCYEPYLSQMYMNAMNDYNIQLDSLYDDFTDDYNAQCAQAFETEYLVHTTRVRRYQTTLFYYDQAGNLVKTVAPEGINGSFNSTDTDIDNARASVINMTTFGAAVVPGWDYETSYQYNTYNQLVSTTNPDQDGDTRFWYDRYGRIAASQNPVQAIVNLYSYTKYDAQGRPVEVGQTEKLTDPSEADLKADDKGAAFEAWVNLGVRAEVTITTYDTTLSTAISNKFESGTTRNLRLRVSTVAYFTVVSGLTDLTQDYESATHYSYDVHGNVVESIQDVPMLANVGQNNKSTQYEFELISGNVQRVAYQEGKLDEMVHAYEYDKLNRLTDVYTSNDTVHRTHEANYRYYDYGPLARKEIGKNKVQGMDFAYTINGWLKGMNASTLDSTRDMGNDAAHGFYTSNPEVHELVAKDVAAYTIGYFEGDYQAIGTSTMEMTYSGTSFNTATPSLYNGNIRHTVTSIYDMGTFGAAYDYDQLQRLKSMEVFEETTNVNTWSGVSATTDYANSYSYDRNGNILKLQRNATSTLGLDMDDFTYHYINVGVEKSNQLGFVSDSAANDGVGNDILTGMNSGNYEYDKIGQLIADVSEGIDLMQWRYGDKKLSRIIRGDANSPEVEFVYNPFGQRVIKIEKPRSGGALTQPGGSDWIYTYYTYDANGQVMAVYSFVGNITAGQTVTVDEFNIYGSSREGQLKSETVVWQNGIPNIGYTGVYQNTLGKRNYEVTNHLGNVLAVITDRNTVVDSTYEAVTIMTTDYYPFGMTMPGRQNVGITGAESYRYAYNGMEQDPEVSGTSNSYTTEFRQYDPRLGRWKSLDPLMAQFAAWSPYNAYENNPVFYVDPHGLASEVVNGSEGSGGPGDPPSKVLKETLMEGFEQFVGELEDGVLEFAPVDYVKKVTFARKVKRALRKAKSKVISMFTSKKDNLHDSSITSTAKKGKNDSPGHYSGGIEFLDAAEDRGAVPAAGDRGQDAFDVGMYTVVPAEIDGQIDYYIASVEVRDPSSPWKNTIRYDYIIGYESLSHFKEEVGFYTNLSVLNFEMGAKLHLDQWQIDIMNGDVQQGMDKYLLKQWSENWMDAIAAGKAYRGATGSPVLKPSSGPTPSLRNRAAKKLPAERTKGLREMESPFTQKKVNN